MCIRDRVFWAFALLFLFCEFGQKLTNHFDQLNVAINDCDWTSFPKKIQKILPIIMQNTQRPVVLRTFENASCSRETFKRVSFLKLKTFIEFNYYDLSICINVCCMCLSGGQQRFFMFHGVS